MFAPPAGLGANDGGMLPLPLGRGAAPRPTPSTCRAVAPPKLLPLPPSSLASDLLPKRERIRGRGGVCLNGAASGAGAGAGAGSSVGPGISRASRAGVTIEGATLSRLLPAKKEDTLLTICCRFALFPARNICTKIKKVLKLNGPFYFRKGLFQKRSQDFAQRVLL